MSPLVMGDVVDAEFVTQCACPGCRLWVGEVNAQRLCAHCAQQCTVLTAQGPMLGPLPQISAAHQPVTIDGPAPASLPSLPPQAVRLARRLAVQRWGAKKVATVERNARDAAEGLGLVADVIRAIQGVRKLR